MSRPQASADRDTVGRSPIVLPQNRPGRRPYRGGVGIERFRGITDADPDEGRWMPEDFVASTTEVFAGGGVGLTTLPDGTVLREAIASDPVGFLGEKHHSAFGTDPMLLVKLLDTRERLFVHYHPSTDFARRALARPSGKTEAWIVVATDGPAYAHLGFARDVAEGEVLDWFRHQNVEAMLAAMNRVDLAPGDSLFVPAGMPHSIGPDVTLVELQQPVDLSIVLEHAGFPDVGAEAAVLGMNAVDAFSDLDRAAVPPGRLAQLSSWRPVHRVGDAEVTRLFPAEAEGFFRADRIESAGTVVLDAGFQVLVVLEGDGGLTWGAHDSSQALPLRSGETVLVPYGSGEITLRGEVTVLRCRPPLPPDASRAQLLESTSAAR